jgi:hypothetical protein
MSSQGRKKGLTTTIVYVRQVVKSLQFAIDCDRRPSMPTPVHNGAPSRRDTIADLTSAPASIVRGVVWEARSKVVSRGLKARGGSALPRLGGHRDAGEDGAEPKHYR